MRLANHRAMQPKSRPNPWIAVIACVLGCAQPENGSESSALQNGPLASCDDQLDHYAAVGLLEMSGRGSCTATLVRPNVVLTAGHCFSQNDIEQGIRDSSADASAS